MSKTLNQIGAEAYETAKSKGFYDSPRTPLEFHMLVVSEIAEATEAVRLGVPSFYFDSQALDPFKPEGELSELADAVIRIADYCTGRGMDLESAVEKKLAYNKTRQFRHGGKRL